MPDYLRWFTDPTHWGGSDGIPTRILEHVQISGSALLIALLIGLPVGLWVGHTGRGAVAAINIANIGRAIPSYALLGMVMPISLSFSPDLGLFVIPTFVARSAGNSSWAGRPPKPL